MNVRRFLKPAGLVLLWFLALVSTAAGFVPAIALLLCATLATLLTYDIAGLRGKLPLIADTRVLWAYRGAAAVLFVVAIATWPPAKPKPPAEQVAAVSTAMPQVTATSVPTAPTTSIPATSTPVPPTATPPRQPPTAVVTSKGLGATVTDWEREHGRPDAGGDYQNGRYHQFAMEGTVWRLERSWGNTPIALAAARTEGKALIPTDAQLVETYRYQDRATVDLYKSEWLKVRLPNDNWTNGEPGNFIIIYRQPSSIQVTSLVIGTGNNP